MRNTTSLDTRGGEDVTLTRVEDGKIDICFFSIEGTAHINLSETRAKQLMLAIANLIGYGANREPRNEVHFIFDKE